MLLNCVLINIVIALTSLTMNIQHYFYINSKTFVCITVTTIVTLWSRQLLSQT